MGANVRRLREDRRVRPSEAGRFVVGNYRGRLAGLEPIMLRDARSNVVARLGAPGD